MTEMVKMQAMLQSLTQRITELENQKMMNDEEIKRGRPKCPLSITVSEFHWCI